MSTTYKGLDRAGIARTGVLPNRAAGSETPAEFTERMFSRGWRSLVLERDGEDVGRIGRNDAGQRSWWAER